MSSKSYWAKRKRVRMDEYHKDSDKVIGKVLEAYQDSINDIDEQMRSILKTFTASNKMTLEEAKKYLTIGESKDFIENIKKTIDNIQDEDLKAEMLRQINTPAYRARLTRLQAMKEKLNIECKKLADIQVRAIEKGLINTANTAYYKTIFDMQQLTGIGFSFAEIPTKQIEEILKNNWSGKHYSKRIWKNTDVLASELEHTLTKGFMTGASVDRMVKEISDKMQVGEFAATRLIRTETTYVANSAELVAYKEAGVEKLMFLATLDLRTSDICRQHDKKIIPVDKAAPGENIPPLHANCRSTTLEVFDDDNLAELQRRARDPVTGKNKTVPANMDYGDWYKENVTNNPSAIVAEKKIKNRASDMKQHDMYRGVLGDEVPKHIDDFQNLKYTNVSEWNVAKGNYRKINYYSKVVQNEPEITNDLLNISKNTNTDLVGLEYRLKTKGSYLRKVNSDSQNSLDLDIIDNVIHNTNDIIRYTYQDSSYKLVDSYNKINDELDSLGYKQVKFKNTWLDKRSAYKGVNCIYMHPNGQKFEVQFHTPESFDLKNGELHKMYEEFRLDTTSDERRMELNNEMFKLSSKLERPKDIENLTKRG